MSDLTIEKFCSYVAPSVWETDQFFMWPPDVFALVASLLLKSGAYCYAVSGWKRSETNRDYVKSMKSVGKEWRSKMSPPGEVLSWRQTIIDNKNARVSDVRQYEELCDALLRLCAAADEASKGVGCTV